MKKTMFNIYWIYGFVFLIIICYSLLIYKGINNSSVETDQQGFYEMLKQGDVEEIKTIRNERLVRVFLNPDSLKNKPAIYRQLLFDKTDTRKYEVAKEITAPNPQLYFSIIDDKTFSNQIGEFYEQNPTVKQVRDFPDDELGPLGKLNNFIFYILLAILVLFIILNYITTKSKNKISTTGDNAQDININKFDNKYLALKSISKILSIISIIVSIVVIVAAFKVAELFKWKDFGLLYGSIIIIFGSFFILLIRAMAELIILFIDIEKNTRTKNIE